MLASGPSCCFAGVLVSEGAEEEEEAVSVVDLAPSEAQPIGWNRSSHRAFTGAASWYFGDPAHLDYDNGARVAGRLTLAPVALPAQTPARLIFHAWGDVEAGSAWDLLVVRVEADGVSVPAWVKGGDWVAKTWQRRTVDLSAWAGHTITLHFEFDSVESTLNGTEGLYLDGIWVLTGCAPAPACDSDEACDDQVRCTQQSCADSECVYTVTASCCALPDDCDDGDTCTLDSCVAGICAHAPVSEESCCNSAADCDDGDPCTDDLCDGDGITTCSHPTAALPGCCDAAADCEDADPCTATACVGHSCVITPTCCATASDCPDDGDPCTLETCTDELCEHPPSMAPECCAEVALDQGFNGDAADWSFEGGGGGCAWHLEASGPPGTDGGVLVYGNGTDYDCGSTAGVARSPELSLATGVRWKLVTRIWLDVEVPSSLDALSLVAVAAPDTEVLLWAKPPSFSAQQKWLVLDRDLSAFAGHTLRLEWRFMTGDANNNAMGGPHVDALSVRSDCQPLTCSSATDCDDGLAPTGEQCLDGACLFTLP
ncbi:MAG: hypothetical protein H6746_05495 [Deltaproteobacteria bacterium]|nr:hypothetical protein [Deltaproteobacteria bacterium]